MLVADRALLCNPPIGITVETRAHASCRGETRSGRRAPGAIRHSARDAAADFVFPLASVEIRPGRERRWRFWQREVWLALQTPLYSASTQIIFDPTNEKLASGDAASQSTIDSLTLDNQIAIVKSTALLRRVVEKEHLVDDPEFGAKPVEGLGFARRPARLSGACSASCSPLSRPFRAGAGIFRARIEDIDYLFSPWRRDGQPPRPTIAERAQSTTKRPLPTPLKESKPRSPR